METVREEGCYQGNSVWEDESSWDIRQLDRFHQFCSFRSVDCFGFKEETWIWSEKDPTSCEWSVFLKEMIFDHVRQNSFLTNITQSETTAVVTVTTDEVPDTKQRPRRRNRRLLETKQTQTSFSVSTSWTGHRAAPCDALLTRFLVRKKVMKCFGCIYWNIDNLVSLMTDVLCCILFMIRKLILSCGPMTVEIREQLKSATCWWKQELNWSDWRLPAGLNFVCKTFVIRLHVGVKQRFTCLKQTGCDTNGFNTDWIRKVKAKW